MSEISLYPVYSRYHERELGRGKLGFDEDVSREINRRECLVVVQHISSSEGPF